MRVDLRLERVKLSGGLLQLRILALKLQRAAAPDVVVQIVAHPIEALGNQADLVHMTVERDSCAKVTLLHLTDGVGQDLHTAIEACDDRIEQRNGDADADGEQQKNQNPEGKKRGIHLRDLRHTRDHIAVPG